MIRDRDIPIDDFDIFDIKPTQDGWEQVPLYVRGWCKDHCGDYGGCGWLTANCPHYDDPPWVHKEEEDK